MPRPMSCSASGAEAPRWRGWPAAPYDAKGRGFAFAMAPFAVVPLDSGAGAHRRTKLWGY